MSRVYANGLRIRTRVPLHRRLRSHPPYRRLHLGLKGAVARESLAHIVQQRDGFLGFAQESQQLSARPQEQCRFVVAPTVLVAHDGVDPPLCYTETSR